MNLELGHCGSPAFAASVKQHRRTFHHGPGARLQSTSHSKTSKPIARDTDTPTLESVGEAGSNYTPLLLLLLIHRSNTTSTSRIGIGARSRQPARQSKHDKEHSRTNTFSPGKRCSKYRIAVSSTSQTSASYHSSAFLRARRRGPARWEALSPR